MCNLRTLFVVTATILSFNCCYGQSETSFTLNGELKGLRDGAQLILVCSYKKKVDTLQRVVSKNEHFRFKGSLSIIGIPYFIYVDTSVNQYIERFIGPIRIIMEPGDITVKGSLDNLSTLGIAVTGTAAHDDYVDFMKLQKALLLPISTAIEQYNISEKQFVDGGRTAEDSLSMIKCSLALDTAQIEMGKRMQNWIAQHSQSLFVPWVIGTKLAGEAREQAYNQLPSSVQHSYFGLELRDAIARDKSLAIGAVAPDFLFATAEGRPISLKDVTQSAKLTLIDFWASWCKPCRASFPHMKELYANYHNRGLSIIGYSTDINEQAWRKALVMELLPWPNIRETYSQAKEAYGVDKLPTLLLLDKEGRILARDPSKDELIKIFEEKLKN